MCITIHFMQFSFLRHGGNAHLKENNDIANSEKQ